ncbi:hypothetical protein IWX90DRAFT_231383 [Phyllosticta citrichinensis]|uniref:Uncharacterized protein n=1 Tax=Phyllosticta citrichinensis TaxID=1130410 RepID=A0ABR1XUV9_9PEZI
MTCRALAWRAQPRVRRHIKHEHLRTTPPQPHTSPMLLRAQKTYWLHIDGLGTLCLVYAGGAFLLPFDGVGVGVGRQGRRREWVLLCDGDGWRWGLVLGDGDGGLCCGWKMVGKVKGGKWQVERAWHKTSISFPGDLSETTVNVSQLECSCQIERPWTRVFQKRRRRGFIPVRRQVSQAVARLLTSS